jgi:archaetidylinositol phosphate synthase
MAEMKAHKRINDILLGPIERPALQWLAAHMPAWVTPDHLTAVGFAGSLIIFSGYALTLIHPAFLWLASLGFVINWFGDSLDGTLARYRDIQRPRYGYFIDHTMDSLSEMLVFLGLGLSPYVRFDLAAMALIGYMLMSILVYITTYVNGEFKISYAKIGPTEMRVLAILANTLIFFIGNPTVTLASITTTVYDVLVGIIAIALITAFIVASLIQASALARMDEKTLERRKLKQHRRELQRELRKERRNQKKLAQEKAGLMAARSKG